MSAVHDGAEGDLVNGDSSARSTPRECVVLYVAEAELELELEVSLSSDIDE